MRFRQTLSGGVAALIILTAADQTLAQAQTPLDIAINNNMGMQQAILNNIPMNTGFRNSRSRPRDSAPARSDRTPATATGFFIATDPDVSARVRESFLANTRQSRGEAFAAQIDQLLGNVRQTFAQMTAPYGLRANDIADVMAAYTVVLWMSANRITNLPQVHQVQGVRQQMHAALAGKLANTRERQSLGETIMYQTCMLVALREQAELGKPEILDALVSAVDSGSPEMGNQLRQMALTDKGLVRR